MAAATQFLASSQGCIAVLNYDDIGLLATGVTVDNTNGTETVKFSIVINDQVLSATVDQVKISTITFPLASAVAVSLNRLTIAGYSSHGIGSG